MSVGTRGARFAIGLWLQRIGIGILPEGRTKSELREVMRAWTSKASAEVALARLRSERDSAFRRLAEETATYPMHATQ